MGDVTGMNLIRRLLASFRAGHPAAVLPLTEDREATARLAAIVEGSGDAIIGKTLDGVITSWNPAAERMFGFTTAEAVGQPITIIVPPDRPEEERNVLRRLAKGEVVEHFDTVRVAKGGRRLDASVTVSPIKNLAGEIVGASKIARDITDRARGDEAARFLSRASDLLASSLDYKVRLQILAQVTVPTIADFCAVDILRDDGSIDRLGLAHVNPEKERLARRLVQRYPLRHTARHGVPAVLRSGRSSLHPELPAWLDEGSVDTDEDKEILRTLALRSLMILPLVAHGRTLGALTLVTGEESGRRYGHADLPLAEELARRAAIAVDNAYLHDEARRRQQEAESARADAEAANRAKDLFLAIVSHELRTPLTAMLGWLRLVRTGSLSPERTAEALETVERNARQQAQIINDLLDVSRIMSGKLSLEPRPVDLGGVLWQAVQAMRREAEAKNIQIETDLDIIAGPVLGDPVRLEQVFVNLISNAVKFTPGGGHVRVRLARHENAARIEVTDTGQGIEPGMLAHIFDPFRQEDGRTTRRHGGLGLGLTIARNLVEIHGGTIRADSRGKGRGASFSVDLPMMPVRVTPPATSVQVVESEAGAERRRLTGVRVLIVDDHPDSRNLLQAVLEGSGATAAVAGSVEEALTVLKSSPIDVVVSDIGMPGADGYDLIRHIRSAENGDPRIPAVALTAFADAEHRERALQAGFQFHVVKPVEAPRFVQIVATAVGR